jgi:hypothetical protein
MVPRSGQTTPAQTLRATLRAYSPSATDVVAARALGPAPDGAALANLSAVSLVCGPP